MSFPILNLSFVLHLLVLLAYKLYQAVVKIKGKLSN